ncbi:MAG: HAD-IIIC family phosphatase, partial [Rhizobacter sp.]|nr:HAD-IIIC family phosphatase [Rhizobacter sp.]
MNDRTHLLDGNEATGVLERPPEPAAPKPVIALAATFTIDGIVNALELVLEHAALEYDVQCGPYHQVFQQLLGSEPLFSAPETRLAIAFVRLQDFVRDLPDAGRHGPFVDEVVDDLLDAAQKFGARRAVPVVYVVFAPEPGADALLQESTARLASGLREIAGASVVSSAAADAACRGARLDPLGDKLAHIPYTAEYFGGLALAAARAAHRALVPPHKVLVLDCDNTLWRGVVGEDGVHGISFPPAALAVQRFAIEAQQQGTLVCLVSKNVEQDVLEVFAQRPEMCLTLDHVVAHRINWEPKSKNILELARELNLGPDSFVFLDDNPLECAEMRTVVPQVTTLQLPADAEVGGFLANLWVFDRGQVTSEDRSRTQLYRENAARRALEASAADAAEFLASLRVAIQIQRPGEDEWPRVSQLTQKTNQFNFTTIRRSELEMRSLERQGREVLSVHVQDRFGDYGLVGVVVFYCEDRALHVDTFLLSCRVLGKGVEQEIVAHLARDAEARGLDRILLEFRATAKNEPARKFAQSIDDASKAETAGKVLYSVPVASARHLKYRLEHVEEALPSAMPGDARQPRPAGALRSIGYERIARQLSTGRSVVDAVRVKMRRPRTLPTPVAVATTETQRRLVALWADAIGVDVIGVDDDYGAVGGTSLMAVGLVASVSQEFGVALPVTSVISAPTVRRMAELLEAAPVARQVLLDLKPGGDSTLYLVHEGNGEALLYRPLAARMPDQLTVIGVQPAGLPALPLPHETVEEMATCYVRAIQDGRPTGPVYLGGLCAGGLIAF